jgi:hypothetical protein
MILYQLDLSNAIASVLHVFLEIYEIKKYFIGQFSTDTVHYKNTDDQRLVCHEIRNIYMKVFSKQLSICPLSKLNILDYTRQMASLKPDPENDKSITASEIF